MQNFQEKAKGKAKANFGAFVRSVYVLSFAVSVRFLQPRLWPWGFAQPWTDRMEYSAVDPINDSLQSKRKSKLQSWITRVLYGDRSDRSLVCLTP